MAKYRKRKDGRYCANISTGKILDNGKAERIMLYGKTVRELDEKITAAKCDIHSGTFVKESTMPLGLYAETWLLSKEGNAHATYAGYQNILKNHIDYIKNVPISKIVKSDVQDCINKLNGHYDLQHRLKITLSQIFEAAIDDGLVYRNPALKIKLPARNQLQKKRALTDAEKNAIKNCNFTIREKTFVNILFFTGMRRGEVLALTKNDINFANGEISVNKSVAFINNNQPELKTPKTKNSVRNIPMPDSLKETLLEYIGTLNTIYLFTTKDGRIMSEGSYKRMWQSIYNKINEQMGGNKNIKVTDLTVHIFRHNYATMLYYQGIDVKQAQLLLGHSNIKTTLEIYTHFVSDDKVKNKLANLAI